MDPLRKYRKEKNKRHRIPKAEYAKVLMDVLEETEFLRNGVRVSRIPAGARPKASMQPSAILNSPPEPPSIDLDP